MCQLACIILCMQLNWKGSIACTNTPETGALWRMAAKTAQGSTQASCMPCAFPWTDFYSASCNCVIISVWEVVFLRLSWMNWLVTQDLDPFIYPFPQEHAVGLTSASLTALAGNSLWCWVVTVFASFKPPPLSPICGWILLTRTASMMCFIAYPCK